MPRRALASDCARDHPGAAVVGVSGVTTFAVRRMQWRSRAVLAARSSVIGIAVNEVMMRWRRRGFETLLLGACIFLPGCASVEPWERGNLAKPQMAFDLDPAQSELRAHAYSSREAGASGKAGAGGGCGCY